MNTLQHLRYPIALFTLFALLLTSNDMLGQSTDVRRRKKLIATGWDWPDTHRLLKNLAEMERRPFDGVVLVANGRTDEDKPRSLRSAFHNKKWKRQWFQTCIDDLNACQFKRFTDNFICIGANPGNVDWFDDEGWQAIVEHWRIAAWVAKQSGVKGLLFDPEPYTKPFSQFAYVLQPQTDKHTFDEYYAKARQRGREVMQVVAEEYPDITIFCYFMNSSPGTAASQSYGLYPAFIDGWLDVIPPTITLVDGCESAYSFNSRRQYLEAALHIKGDCQELVSPANRAKYRAQVQVGFGLYLDAYWNPKGSTHFIDGLGGSRLDRLRDNVGTALQVADEYVWIYGEKYRWWPVASRGMKKKTWPEALPGCEDMLCSARDPIGFANIQMAQLEKAGKLVNLIRNGRFDSEKVAMADGHEATYKKGGLPAGWRSWQSNRSKGTFTWDRQMGDSDKGSAKAAGVVNGCFIQQVEAKAGQRFAVRAKRRVQGKGDAWIRVGWKTAEGAWTSEILNKRIFCQAPANQWAELFDVVKVPEGVGSLVVLLSVTGQTSPDDIAQFDNVEVYRLP